MMIQASNDFSSSESNNKSCIVNHFNIDETGCCTLQIAPASQPLNPQHKTHPHEHVHRKINNLKQALTEKQMI